MNDRSAQAVVGRRRWWLLVLALVALALTAAVITARCARAAEALNPFGPIRTERDDAVPGYVELSNGKIIPGNVYMTRDKRVKLWDDEKKRQREVPLPKIREIQCKVKKEWIEKEWRFKELALDEKMYTGRSYPSREYDHVVTLLDGRKIEGQLSEIVYVQPFVQSPDKPMAYRPNIEPFKFLLHKRDKREISATLKTMVYVKRIKLGEEAYKEGKEKAMRGPSVRRPASEPADEEAPKPKAARKTAAKEEAEAEKEK